MLGNAKHDRSLTNISKGLLFHYTKNERIYHCPADKSFFAGNQRHATRLRSYSLLGWLGSELEGKGWKWPTQSVVNSRKVSEITTSPSQAFTFLDEHYDSIDDGIFAICEPGLKEWMELPSDGHNRACNLAFLDGRAAQLVWRTPKLFRYYGQRPNGPADKQDLEKIQALIPLPETGSALET